MASFFQLHLDNSKANEFFSIETPSTPVNLLNCQHTLSKTWNQIFTDAFGSTTLNSYDVVGCNLFYVPNSVEPKDVVLYCDFYYDSSSNKSTTHLYGSRSSTGQTTLYPCSPIIDEPICCPKPPSDYWISISRGLSYSHFRNIKNTKLTPAMCNYATNNDDLATWSAFLTNPEDFYLLVVVSNRATRPQDVQVAYAIKPCSELMVHGLDKTGIDSVVTNRGNVGSVYPMPSTGYPLFKFYYNPSWSVTQYYFAGQLFTHNYIDSVVYKLLDGDTLGVVYTTTRTSGFTDEIILRNTLYDSADYILEADYTFKDGSTKTYTQLIGFGDNKSLAPTITIPSTLSCTLGDVVTIEATISDKSHAQYIGRTELYLIDSDITVPFTGKQTTLNLNTDTLQLTSNSQRVIVRYYTTTQFQERFTSNVCVLSIAMPPFENPTITTPVTTNVNLSNSITYGFTLNNLVNRISTMDVVISSGGISVYSAMGLTPATSYTLPADTLYYGDEYTLTLTLHCVNGTDVSSSSVTMTYIAPSTLPDMPTPTVADMVLDPYRVNVITPWEHANLITTTVPSLTTSVASITRTEDANGFYNGQYHISVYNNNGAINHAFKICDIPSSCLSKKIYLSGGTSTFKLHIGNKDTSATGTLWSAMMSEINSEHYKLVATDSGSGVSYTLPSTGEFGVYVALPNTDVDDPTYEGDIYPRLSFNSYLPSTTTFTETSIDLSTIVTAQLMLANDTNEIYEALNIDLAKNAINISEYTRLSNEYDCNICLTDTYRRKWISNDFKITLQHLMIENPTLIAEELLTLNPSEDFVGHVALNNPAECISSINLTFYLANNYDGFHAGIPFNPAWHKVLSQNINVDLTTGTYFVPAETVYWFKHSMSAQYVFMTIVGAGGEIIKTDEIALRHLEHENPDEPIEARMNVSTIQKHISGSQMDVLSFNCTHFSHATEVWFMRDCYGDPNATTEELQQTVIYTDIPVSKDYEISAFSIPYSKYDETTERYVPYNYTFYVKNEYNTLYTDQTARLYVDNTVPPLVKPRLIIPDNFIITDPLPMELIYNNPKSNLKYVTVKFYEHGTTTLALTYGDKAFTGNATLPANRLPDGDYDVVMTVQDIFDQTIDSDPCRLTAFTPPVFTFNMPDNNILDATHYEFECKAVDYEAYVPSMRLKLYVGDKLVALSPLYENVYGRIGIKHRFIDLNDATEYRIECEIDLGTIKTKVAETFYVDYHKPTAYSLLYLDNKCNDGCVGIRGHVVSSHAETFPEQPKFIGGEWIDLVGGDPYVYWDNGFQIPDSFTFGAWMKYANLGKLITLGSAVNGYTIELVRGTESGTVKYRYVVRGYVDGVKTFERVSSAISNLCQDSSGYILFRKNGNTYTFSVTMSDTTTNENWVWGADTGVGFGYNTQKQWGDTNTTMPTFETLTTDMESIFPLGQIRIGGGKYDCVWVTSDVTTPFANITMPTDWDNNTRFLCLFDDSINSGNIDEVLNMFPKLKIKRHKKGGENDWVTLKVVDMTELLGEDTEWKDYFVPHGYDAEYALVPTTANGDEGGYIIGDIKTSFNVYTIADANNAFAFKAEVRNPLNRNTQIGMFTLPIGNFPILQRNNELDYDNGTFSTKILGYDYDSTHRLDRKDISKQTEDICNFLNDFNAKVLKDWNGGIWIVRFNEGVKQESGNTDLDMSISAPWVEQGIFDNQADLYYNGLSTELTP